jgi:hypothetical protein
MDRIEIEEEMIVSPVCSFLQTKLKLSEHTNNIIDVLYRFAYIQAHFSSFDLMQVFDINRIELDCLGAVTSKVVSTHPFFDEWDRLSIKDVADHTTFLRLYGTDTCISSNLSLTEKFLINQMDDELYKKCLETYRYQPPSARGGPLLIAIMLKELLFDIQEITRTLLMKLHHLKVSDFEGENIQSFVSYVELLILGLRCIERRDSTNPTMVLNPLVPENLPRTLVARFQASTVPEFSELFRFISVRQLMGGASFMPSDKILSAAENTYIRLKVEGRWSPSAEKAPDATFKADLIAGKICWNCERRGHRVNDCRKRRNEDTVLKNMRDYYDAKSNSNSNHASTNAGGSRGRGRRRNPYRPPAHGEKNTRVISGVPMYYHFNTKTWKIDERISLDQLP